MPNSIDIALYGSRFINGTDGEVKPSLLSTFGYFLFTPAESPYIGDYEERTLKLLVEQFQRDKPNLHGFILSFVKEMQKIEDIFRDLQTLRGLTSATGNQLDLIGKIVGQSRTSGDDEVYRSDIIFKIYLNTSSGQSEVLIQALIKFTGVQTVDIKESNPATVTFTINRATKPIPPSLKSKLNKLTPAGVQVFIQLNNSETPFIFDGEGSYPPYFSGAGFGETGVGNEDIGGNFTELLSN